MLLFEEGLGEKMDWLDRIKNCFTGKTIKDCFEQIFLWPLFGGVTTFFGVLAGYLGAHYDKEIAASFLTLGILPGREFAAGPTLFWVITTAFGACFTGTFWAQARSAARISEKMVGTTHEIDNKTNDLVVRALELDERVRRLHTLPPVGFLETYREIVISSEEAYELTRAADLEFPALEVAIRTQLLWILQLAQAFDADGIKASYGANVMLYYPRASLNENELKAFEARIRFVEKGVSPANLEGVLDLVCEFSVSRKAGTPLTQGQDNSLTPMALPIPKLSDEERKLRAQNGVLPGAPDAFTSQLEAVIETPSDWKERADTDHFSAPLRRQLTEFFEQSDAWMQSLVSIPLFKPDSQNKGTPIGTLNIHRDLPNKLAAEKYELLSPLLVPITLTLSRLLWNNFRKVDILRPNEERKV